MLENENVKNALIYGSVATAIVSLLSVSGAIIMPLFNGKQRQRWMHFFVAMATSTLSADALLHIIPQILGLHNHSHHHEHDHDNHSDNSTHEDHDHDHHGHDHHEHHDHHDHNHGNDGIFTLNDERLVLLKLSTILLAIYTIYLIEFIFRFRKRQREIPSEKLGQCPAHDNSLDTINDSEASNSENSDHPTCCGLRSRAVVILVGDGFHNFIDGLAMGASFMVSPQLGIGTTIAVCCHELPHELGDLAVLLDSGMSMPKALFLNLLSALTAFLGLYVAILVGSDKTVEIIFLGITAGMFLYVGWIEMLPHLKSEGIPNDHWLLACGLQYGGFFTGFILIFLLGWFEHDLFNTMS